MIKFDTAFTKILIHTMDRFIAFSIIYRAGRSQWPDEINKLNKMNTDIAVFWKQAGIPTNIYQRLNLHAISWDLMQCNFAYDKAPSFTRQSEELTMWDGRFSIKYLQEFKAAFNPDFLEIKKSLPVLDRLRAYDITNQPNLEKLISETDNAIRIQHRIVKGHKTKDYEISENESEKIYAPFLFYPEMLYPGINLGYILPDDSEAKKINISIDYQATDSDITEALENFQYQFLRFKNYYHTSHTESNEIIPCQFKTLIKKPTRDNKFIKQENSIFNTLSTLLVYDYMSTNHTEQQIAINDVVNSLKTQQFNITKKSIRDRLGFIETSIAEKAAFLRSQR